jgi:subtilisin family serine protease
MTQAVFVTLEAGFSSDDRRIQSELLVHGAALEIEKTYVRYSTLLVQVTSGNADEYARWAAHKTFVSSATPEFSFRVNSLLPMQSYLDCRLPRLLGLVGPLAPAGSGLGVTVGTVDTGLASHACSPALTFHEYRNSDFLWNDIDKLHQFAGVPGTNAAAWGRSGFWNRRASLDSAIDRVADFELRNATFWGARASLGVGTAATVAATWRQEIDAVLSLDELAILSVIHESSFNFVDQTLDITDSCGHGTAIATLALGRDTIVRSRHIHWFSGIAPDARLAVYKVANTDNEAIRASVVVDALNAALTNPDLDILCFSLGTDFDPPPGFILTRQLQDLRRKNDVLVFAPAGNSCAVGLAYPARLPEVCAIAAVTRSLAPSSFTNQADLSKQETCDFCFFGGDALTGDLRDDYRADRLFAAPNHQEGFAGICGTSVACAGAAGTAALVLSRLRQNVPRRLLNLPNTASRVYSELVKTANTMMLGGNSAPHHIFGHGLITAK